MKILLQKIKKNLQSKKLFSALTITLSIILIALNFSLGSIIFILAFFAFWNFNINVKIISIITLVVLIICAILLLFNNLELAEKAAIYAYSGLVMNVILLLFKEIYSEH